MARLTDLGASRRSTSIEASARYDKLADAAGFDRAPRLGRMVASLIILPKKRRKEAAKKRRS